VFELLHSMSKPFYYFLEEELGKVLLNPDPIEINSISENACELRQSLVLSKDRYLPGRQGSALASLQGPPHQLITQMIPRGSLQMMH
jgi:hypothetical protein